MLQILINNNDMIYSYIVESCDFWHMRLGHVNLKNKKKLVDSYMHDF